MPSGSEHNIMLNSIPQAEYEVSSDEKRIDCGLKVLETYFTNGVNILHKIFQGLCECHINREI